MWGFKKRESEDERIEKERAIFRIKHPYIAKFADEHNLSYDAGGATIIDLIEEMIKERYE